MTDPHTIEVVGKFAKPIDQIWELVSDFRHIDRWARLMVLKVEGSGPGCKRTVKMESGAVVVEQLLSLNNDTKTLEYGIVGVNPFPMKEYRSCITLHASAPSGCTLVWQATYVPANGTAPEKIDNLLNKVYTGGIALLQQYFVTP